MTTDLDADAISAALIRRGSPAVDRIEVLPNRGNNRSYRIQSGESAYFLKKYFRHPDDLRNRMETEWLFTSFAWENGIRAVPEPIACSLEGGFSIFEFIEGAKIAEKEIDESVVAQAGEFFRALNSVKGQAYAMGLPEASESCFSGLDYVSSVEFRLERLDGIPAETAIEREALEFIRGALKPAWRSLRYRVDSIIEEAGGITALAEIERCVSPSDFGFHNSIRERNGLFRFIDFEYAGWDDPVKMVCDFFSQHHVPVSMRHFDRFAEAAFALFPNPEKSLQRIRFVLPITRFKWCCLILNEFSPEAEARRIFSDPGGEIEAYREEQLHKAKKALVQLQDEFELKG